MHPSLEHDSNDSNLSRVAAKSDSAEVISIITDSTNEHKAPLWAYFVERSSMIYKLYRIINYYDIISYGPYHMGQTIWSF